MHIAPVTLEGKTVRLEPLELAHCDALCEIGLDEDLWRWTPHAVSTPDQMRAHVAEALRLLAAGTALPFVTVLRESGQMVGSSRFGNIDCANRRVEIGWTWIGRPWQRTAVNTEAKFLMLRHAFEIWNCVRVELKTDVLNQRSRRAIERIGARQEGVLRQHMVTYSGRLRDTVYYSILDREWPDVKASFARLGYAAPG
jgi:RimJ/RimL family protein N-acetyltransferase